MGAGSEGPRGDPKAPRGDAGARDRSPATAEDEAAADAIDEPAPEPAPASAPKMASHPPPSESESAFEYGYAAVGAPGHIDIIRRDEFRRLEGVAYLDHAGAPPYSEALVRECMTVLQAGARYEHLSVFTSLNVDDACP